MVAARTGGRRARGIATTLCGTAVPDELTANVLALRRPIDAALLGEVRGILRAVANRTWNSGRRENN